MGQLVVRGSEVNSFLRCRKKWNWEWNEGYKARQKSDKLFFGDIFHKFAEVLYSTNDEGEAFSAAIDLYEASGEETDPEIWEMFAKIAQNYLEK